VWVRVVDHDDRDVAPGEKRARPWRVCAALTDADYEFTKFDVSAVAPNTVIYLCARVENVKFLNTYFFAEPHLEARLITVLPEAGLLATTSTGDGSGTDGVGQLPRPAPVLMQRILLPGSDNLGRISSVSTRNTNGVPVTCLAGADWHVTN